MGYNIYEIQKNAEIRVRLTTAPGTRHGALVENKYSIAVVNNGKTWTCPKVLNGTDILLSKKCWQTTHQTDWVKKVFR